MRNKIITILTCSFLILNITACKNKMENVYDQTNTNTENTENTENIENMDSLSNLDSSSQDEDNSSETNNGNTLNEEQQTELNNSDNTEQFVEQPIIESSEMPKEDTPSCTAKKFNNTYSYVYSTKEECHNSGYNVFEDVSANIDDSLSFFGCEEITDECGTIWYGIYFKRYSDGSLIKVYY